MWGQNNCVAMLRTRSAILVCGLVVIGLVCKILIRNTQPPAYFENEHMISAENVHKVPHGNKLRHVSLAHSATREKQNAKVTRQNLRVVPNEKDFVESAKSNEDMLATRNKILNVVYFLWCEKKIFTFRHYLSVLSVEKFLQPDQIIFYYANRPRTDKYEYNTWFDDLYDQPFFRSVQRLDAKKYCKSKTQKMKFIKKILSPLGGKYVHENTIFTSYPAVFMTANSVDGLNQELKGFFAADEMYMKNSNRRGAVNLKTSCLPEYKLRNHQLYGNTTCLIETRDLYPRDLWDKKDDYSKHLQMLFYGKMQLKPSPSSNELVPNIAHMFYVGGGKMDYIFYLGCLSLIYVVKVDKLYVHGDVEPTGVYWKKIKLQPKLKFIRRVMPKYIYGQKTRIYNHMSDIFRADVLRKYGGIYSDVDVIWTKPLPDWVRQYDAVASYDWPGMYPTYPDYVNFGVSFGKKNAPFWHLFLQSMKKFRDDLFGYNGLLRVYKVYERNPHLLYLYDRLQVMCWNLRCHPTWYPNWRMLNASHLNGPKLRLHDAHAFHWTAPSPPELKNETVLLKSSGLWADIGKNVLRKAGIIK